MPTETPEPGVYPDVDYDTYASWDAINFHILNYFRHSAAHARYAMTAPEESKAHLAFGLATHIAVLEPKRFDEEVLVVPKVDKRTKAGKAEWAAFEQRSQGRMLVKADEYDALSAIKRNCLNHPTVTEILHSEGANEISLLWKDPELGVLCKGRLDRIAALGGTQAIVVDLKTIGRPAASRTCERVSYDFGYHVQAAMYLHGLSVLRPVAEGGDAYEFFWIFAESAPPNLVRLFRADENVIADGYAKYRDYLFAYSECKKHGKWPGWGEGVDELMLPAWAQKVFDATN